MPVFKKDDCLLFFVRCICDSKITGNNERGDTKVIHTDIDALMDKDNPALKTQKKNSRQNQISSEADSQEILTRLKQKFLW